MNISLPMSQLCHYTSGSSFHVVCSCNHFHPMEVVSNLLLTVQLLLCLIHSYYDCSQFIYNVVIIIVISLVKFCYHYSMILIRGTYRYTNLQSIINVANAN